MADLHIEDFYQDVALILLRLHAQFPRPQILFVDDICKGEQPDEFGLPSARHLACFSAMVWLGEHDYLRFASPIRQEALDQAVLSRKGFLLLSSRSTLPPLGAAPDHATLPASLIEESMLTVAQLRRALASNSSQLIRQCVHDLLSRSAPAD